MKSMKRESGEKRKAMTSVPIERVRTLFRLPVQRIGGKMGDRKGTETTVLPEIGDPFAVSAPGGFTALGSGGEEPGRGAALSTAGGGNPQLRPVFEPFGIASNE